MDCADPQIAANKDKQYFIARVNTFVMNHTCLPQVNADAIGYVRFTTSRHKSFLFSTRDAEEDNDS